MCPMKKQCHHIDGLVQERCNSIANALELHLSFTNPSMWHRFAIKQTMGTAIADFSFMCSLNDKYFLEAGIYLKDIDLLYN